MPCGHPATSNFMIVAVVFLNICQTPLLPADARTSSSTQLWWIHQSSCEMRTILSGVRVEVIKGILPMYIKYVKFDKFRNKYIPNSWTAFMRDSPCRVILLVIRASCRNAYWFECILLEKVQRRRHEWTDRTRRERGQGEKEASKSLSSERESKPYQAISCPVLESICLLLLLFYQNRD